MHTDDTTVIISGLVPRNEILDRKRIENIEKNKHLNRSVLHLNATGTCIICYNLLSFTCDVFDLDFLH